jgi:hypothetical protein
MFTELAVENPLYRTETNHGTRKVCPVDGNSILVEIHSQSDINSAAHPTRCFSNAKREASAARK